MPFQSRVDKSSDQFSTNREDMLGLLGQLRALETKSADMSEKRKPRFRERGQLTPRQRLARLLDPGMPFLHLHSIAGYLCDDPDPDKSIPGASLIAGIGFVSGTRVLVWVDDSGIKAGAFNRSTLAAVLSIEEIAKRQKLPVVHLVESAGANLLEYETELWAEAGAVFRNLANLSAMGIPVISVLHGPSTAGGAYMPGLSDYVIGIKNNGMAALAGAALVQAATGEVANDRELGGSEMHATKSGVVEYLADNDAHGIDIARQVVAHLDWNIRHDDNPNEQFADPSLTGEDLAGVVPRDYHIPYDAREIISRFVDGSEFIDFKPGYGPATLCVQAKIHGHSCGLIANNGPIDPAGATKATQFIQLCDSSNHPIIFLNNTTGYMVGTEYEQAGMIKHGSKMIQAVSNTRVPRITLYVGASFGAGNYGMSGYAYKPDFIFAWPNAMTGVMGGEQAAGTMQMVARAAAKRNGTEVDEDKLSAQFDRIKQLFDRQTDAFYTSGRCLDHGIIDPRDTRKVLGFCLDTCREANTRKLNPNSFGIARM